MNKAFRIEYSVLSESGVPMVLGKAVIQANHGSDMDVVSGHCIRRNCEQLCSDFFFGGALLIKRFTTRTNSI